MKIKSKPRKVGFVPFPSSSSSSLLSSSGLQKSSSTASTIPSPIKVNNRGWDDLAFIFFFLAVIGTFLFETLIVLKKLYPSDQQSNAPVIHWIFGLYILHNIIGNFIQIILNESTIKGKLLMTNNSSPSSSQSNQDFCFTCETYRPPRSFHCYACDVCILKRDHHCTFARTCIGFYNYRYFICLLIYIAIGSFYGSVLNMFFIWDLLGGFNFYNFLSHTFPFLFWLFGRLPLYTTCCCLVSVINIAALLFTLGLLSYHGSMIVNNQTVNEKSKAIRIYDLGDWKLNIEQSFGANWHLILLSPLISSKLPGNGQDFLIKQEYFLNSSKMK